MRNFEQRMAQIAFRSEQILAKRRKTRKIILTVCIPLILCVSLYAAFFLPENGDKTTGIQNDMEGSLMGSSTGSTVCSYSEVRIQSSDAAGTDRTVTDKVAVTKIFSAIHALYQADGVTEAVPEDQDGNETKEQYAAGSTVQDTGYTITLSTPWGAQTIYTLSGSQLTDKATGETRTLTASQLAQLYAVLGLS